jgi:hypothetical protein
MNSVFTFVAVLAAAVYELGKSLVGMIPVLSSSGAASTAPPASMSPLAAAYLKYNNDLSYFETDDTLEIRAKGVVIHKINAAQAQAEADQVEAHSKKPTFTSGCLAIESALDPNCENGNLGPGESNTANDPGGYDVGVAQEKLKYLIGQRGITTVDEARAFSLDITKAIPYHCAVMEEKLAWAQATIAANLALRESTKAALDEANAALTNYQDSLSDISDPAADELAKIAELETAVKAAEGPYAAAIKPDARLMAYPDLLSTGAYNFGETGMLELFNSGQFPSHCQHVWDLTNYFDTALGKPPTFTAISS